MQDLAVASDEPTRLEKVVKKLFAGQSDTAVAKLSDGGSVTLTTGADEQDDCAVLRLTGSQDLVAGSDYVRGVKFRLYELGYLDEFDIGYYLAMANFSDIAAMGAQPVALLSVVRYPKSMSDENFASILEGIRGACARVGAPNVGGDIGTAERVILSGSALGVVESGRALLRSGARPGDLLCVTGPTGIAGAAQRYLGVMDIEGQRLGDAEEQCLLNQWRRPQARVEEGRLLSTSGVVTSCQDSSDGLKAAIESISTLSGVGFAVDEAKLPVTDVVAEVARRADIDPHALVLGDSVDFELVFTVEPENVSALRDLFTARGLRFFEIGIATEEQRVVFRRDDGDTTSLPGAGWRHTG